MQSPSKASSENTVYFVAYPSHASLRSDVLQLIANLDAGMRESQKALAARALETAAREVLQVLVADLVTRLKNPDKPNADIHKNLARLDEHIGSFCKLLAGVLSNEKILPVMHHFRQMLMDIDDTNGTPAPWVGFRVDAAFVNELRAVSAHLRDENTAYDAARTMQMLDTLTDVVLYQFLEIPKTLMGFGFVMRKTADGGLAVIRNAMHGMMHRAIPELSARQRSGLADHLDSVLLALPPDHFI